MRKLKGILVLVLLLALFASPIAVLASDISGARYYGTIIVSNNSTATTNVAVNCTISTQSLIDGGYLNSSANNCVVRSSAGADLPFMPSVNATYPWCVWVPDIGENSHLSDILYVVESTGGEIRYFPAAGGMSTPDSATLELDDNFTIEQSGWVDTTYEGNITNLITSENLSQSDLQSWGADNLTDGSLTSLAFHTDSADPNAYMKISFDSSVELTGWRYYVNGGVTAIWNIQYSDNDVDWTTAYTGLDCSGGSGWKEAKWWSSVGAHPYWQSLKTNAAAGGLFHTQLEILRETELLVFKPDAIATYISGSGNITSFIVGGGNVTVTDISSGKHTPTTSVNLAFLGLGIDIGDDTGFPSITDNITLNMPLWSDALSDTTFTTVDAYAHSCTVTGAVWSSEGRYFDGINDVINCGNATILQTVFSVTSDNMSIGWWQKLSATPNNIRGIITKGADPNFFSIWWDNANDDLYFQRKVGGAADTAYMHWVDAYDSAYNDTWVHYMMIIEGRSTANTKLYRNNILLSSTSGIDTLSSDLANTGDDLFAPGQAFGVQQRFMDYLGEVIVFGKGLTATERTQIFNSTKWKYTGGHTDDDFQYVYSGVSIPDNANDWTYYENMGAYWEYTDIEIDGVQQQRIEWEYGTTFTDLSGNSHDATPTFRTTSSDADVSAVLTSFLPVSEAKAPAYALEDAPAFIETVPDIVSEFAVTPPAGTFPLAGVIRAVASATDTPAQLPLLLTAAFVIIACSLAVSATMRRYGSGSLIVKSLVITALMGVFIAIGNFGINFWMLFVFLIIAVALSMGSKQVGWQ